MNSRQWKRILASVAVAPLAPLVRADSYLTESQAAAVIFPGVSMQPGWVGLTSQQIQAIQQRSGAKPLSNRLRVWEGPAQQRLFVDEVIGKHDRITYAVGLTPDGAVAGVEILEYREAYGAQIREATWRRKFIGKRRQDAIALDRDIPNISGATLSSKHVTDGVRRIVQTAALLFGRP